MNRRKVTLGVTTILISTLVLSLYYTSEDIRDIGAKGNIKDTLSLISINDTILSMVQNIDKDLVENRITDKTTEEIIVVEDIVVEGNTKEREHPPTPTRGSATTESRSKAVNLDNHLNNYVLDVIKTYSLEDGNYPYLLNNDFQNYNGVTEDLYYQGEILLKANPNGNKASHCTGITFEVFFKAMQQRNKAIGIPVDDFNGMSKDELFDFALTWYVALGSKSESNLSVAIEKYGLGNKITNLEELRPGDFIDLSRENNTGHTAIFQNWIREGNKIIGFRHWSSQQSTNGISYKEEYFNVKDSKGRKYGNVIIDNLYMARVGPVNEYKKY